MQTTICNPLNLSYRFCLDNPSRREAADPTMIMFKGEYFLFASKSGGYWHSTDLIHWDFITSSDLPFEDYAPTAVVIKDNIYFIASGGAPVKIYKTSDPKSGKWEVVNGAFPIGMTDPDLFLDDDGRLYFYYGCSNVNPIYGVELDLKTLNPVGKPVECFNSNKAIFGWEQPGDYNNTIFNMHHPEPSLKAIVMEFMLLISRWVHLSLHCIIHAPPNLKVLSQEQAIAALFRIDSETTGISQQ
jgi:hypothetical protein